MYRYDEFDATLVRERVTQFRGQVDRRLSGELSEDAFKPLRLMNGLYLQLHAYMLRVAIPYGTLSSRQMRRLAHVARVYDKGYAHFTTRQNIQFNWPALINTPAILDDLAEVEMHAIQTSGNCIRNVTSDQYAGAIADEVEDPRVWCEIIRQWSTFHPEFSYLPRKFKIAVTACENDRAAVKAHDIGLRLLRRGEQTGFEVLVGGGLGRTPYLGQVVNDFVDPDNLLAYLEAILRVYNRFGRRDNKYKARIKILVNELGIEAFRAEVEAAYAAMDRAAINVPAEEIERIRAYFAPPAFETLTDDTPALDAARAADRNFDRWVRNNTLPHAVAGYAIANISLKSIGAVPGDISADQMDCVADLAETYSFDEVRATHEQNLCLVHVRRDDLYTVWKKLDAHGLGAANAGKISDIIACPGLDYCALANARSIPIAQQIAARFAEAGKEDAIGDLKIKISGCINACGHHHLGAIGILGVDKKGEEFYQILLGGSGDENASIGRITGPALSADDTIDAVERLVDFYLEKRNGDEAFLAFTHRLGLDPLKEIIHAHH